MYALCRPGVNASYQTLVSNHASKAVCQIWYPLIFAVTTRPHCTEACMKMSATVSHNAHKGGGK